MSFKHQRLKIRLNTLFSLIWLNQTFLERDMVDSKFKQMRLDSIEEEPNIEEQNIKIKPALPVKPLKIKPEVPPKPKTVQAPNGRLKPIPPPRPTKA